MSTEMETLSQCETKWAAEAGARVAAHRAERLAERQAVAEAEEGRRCLPPELFRQRFAVTAALIVEAVDEFGRAAAIAIDADPVSAGSVRLTAHGGTDMLALRLDDHWVTVDQRARSRGEQTSIDLAAEDYSPEPTARLIAERWCRQLELEEALHVTR
jgi:hypothetical protein